jgi:hypothetical protein
MLARAVHASPTRHLSAEQAADAAGVQVGALRAITKYAQEQGWIVGRRGGGRGGYEAGAEAPE